MAINPISSGAFAPSSSPAALLSFFCSIVFRQPERQSKALPLLFYIRFFSSTLSCSLILLITRHGLPAARQPGGISRVTTLPAPITQPSPIVTPPHTVTFPASQQLLPMLDRLCVLQIICAAVRSCANIALLTEKRVHRRKQAAIRPEEHIVANRDRAAVENGEIKICVAILAKIRKYAVVKIHRPLQKQPRLSVRRKLLENFGSQLFLVLVGVVILPAELMRLQSQSGKLGIRRIVELIGEHVLKLLAHSSAMISHSTRTSLGRRATSTQLLAG